MTIQPRDQDDVYESIRDQITSKISKVTNFVQGSFNRAFIGAYSDQIRESEIPRPPKWSTITLDKSPSLTSAPTE